MFTKEDIEYSGPEILRWEIDSVETARLFMKEFFKTPVGQQIVAQGLRTKSSMEAVLGACQESTGHDDVSFAEFQATARQMFLAGDLQPEATPVATPVAPATLEPEVERDRLGRPLSPKAKQWKRWQEWCNDPGTSMKEILEQRRTNSEFAEFYANQSVRERSSGVGDAVEDLSERRIRETTQITPELKQFVEDYRHMSSAQLKNLLSPLMSGEEPAHHYQQLFDAAMAAGLIWRSSKGERQMSFLGELFAHGVEGMDEVHIRPSRKFTRQDLIQIADRGASEFRDSNANLLSCYDLENEFGLYSTLGNYVQTKNPANDEIARAIQDGDEIALAGAFRHAMEFAFVALLEKGALKRLQLVSTWPPEATADYARIRVRVIKAESEERPSAQAVVAAVPVAVAPVETPVETCAREFRELPSAAWQMKWFRDQRNRPIAEQAAAEGKI